MRSSSPSNACSPGTWLAALGAQEGSPFILGQALSMTASPAGKATTDQLDAPTSAGLLRGGMLPHASVYPAERRATRELRRRRLSRTRTPAAPLPHGQHTTSQYHRPAIGNTMADQAHRAGVAERCPEPAVQQSLAVDLALLGYSDERLRDLA